MSTTDVPSREGSAVRLNRVTPSYCGRTRHPPLNLMGPEIRFADPRGCHGALISAMAQQRPSVTIQGTDRAGRAALPDLRPRSPGPPSARSPGRCAQAAEAEPERFRYETLDRGHEEASRRPSFPRNLRPPWPYPGIPGRVWGTPCRTRPVAAGRGPGQMDLLLPELRRSEPRRPTEQERRQWRARATSALAVMTLDAEIRQAAIAKTNVTARTVTAMTRHNSDLSSKVPVDGACQDLKLRCVASHMTDPDATLHRDSPVQANVQDTDDAYPGPVFAPPAWRSLGGLGSSRSG